MAEHVYQRRYSTVNTVDFLGFHYHKAESRTTFWNLTGGASDEEGSDSEYEFQDDYDLSGPPRPSTPRRTASGTTCGPPSAWCGP